jgi:hypothetical protein
MRGIAREKAELPSQAAPLQADLIVEVLAGLGDSPLERRDAAILALGYCFARRGAELSGLDYAKLGDGDGVLKLRAKTLEVQLPSIVPTSSGLDVPASLFWRRDLNSIYHFDAELVLK